MRKRLITALIALLMVFSSFSVSFATVDKTSTTAGSKLYADVDGHWAAKAIYKWSDYGIIKGSNGNFRPNDLITRGEMACILDNLMGYKTTVKNTFSDLKNGQFYTNAILKAYAAGIIKGDGASILRPTDKITREEAAVLIAKTFAVNDGTINNSKFADSQLVSAWARASVFGLEAKGYINGSSGKFNPKTNITRAEIVTIIDRIVKAYYTKAGTYSDDVTGTAVIKAADVVLDGVDITENLIIAEGVGQGDVSLNSVTVKENTVVRGGGENSVHISGKSGIAKIRIEKVEDKIRIVVDDGNTVDIEVAKGEEIIITGSVGELEIATPDAVVHAKAADIENTKVTGSNVTINVDKDTKIGNVSVDNTAEKTAVKTEKGAVLGTVTAAAKTDISGEGTVENVVLNKGADNSNVSTPNTKTTVNEGVKGAISGGVAVEAGSTIKNDEKGKGGEVEKQKEEKKPEEKTPTSGGSTPGGSTTISVSGIKITNSEPLSLVAGGATGTITTQITPDNATNNKISWSSSDETVATVEAGVVTPVGVGNATITATTNDGRKTATIKVTVKAKVIPAESITLPSSISLKACNDPDKNSAKLTATIKPSNTTSKITWTSGDDKVATVKDGVVTAVGAGNTTIIATIDGKSASTKVYVEGYITIDPIKNIEMQLKTTQNVIIKTSPEETNKTIQFVDENGTYVKNSNIVKVSNEDKSNKLTIEAIGVGEAKISILCTSANYESSRINFTVTVKPEPAKPVAVTGIQVPKALDMVIGGVETIIATIIPENATNTGVNWSSSNEEVATVVGGTVEAKKAGTAEITATSAENTSMSAITTVTVLDKITLKTVDKITLDKGTQKSITITSNVTGAAITVKSDDNSIATVTTGASISANDVKLLINAISGGNTKITVTYEKAGYKTESISFFVDVTIPVEKVELDQAAFELVAGNDPVKKTKKLTATITPSNASNTNIIWTSSDTDVATVEDGQVTAVAAGEATITATAENTTKSAIAAVTVIGTIAITPIDNLDLGLNSTKEVTITSVPADTVKTVISSNTNAVTVSEVVNNKFTITTFTGGTAKITVTCKKEGYEVGELSFVVNVAMTDAQKLTADKALLKLPLGENKFIDVIKVKLGELPKILPNGTTVTWNSSNTAVVSNDGKTVTRPAENDVAVTMTATLTNGTISKDVPFNITVKHVLPEMTAPNGVVLTNTGKAQWKNSVTNYGYEILLYKGSNKEYVTTIPIAKMSYSSVDISDSLSKYGPNTYSIAIRTIGNSDYDDSPLSDISAERYQLANPEPYWDNYIAKWNSVSNGKWYDVRLYKDGNQVIFTNGYKFTQTSINMEEYITDPESEYYFTVQALTTDLEGMIQSEVVKSEAVLPLTSKIDFLTTTIGASINFDGIHNVIIGAENGTKEIIIKAYKTVDQTIICNEASILSQTETDVVYKIDTTNMANGGCRRIKLTVTEKGKTSDYYNIDITVKLKAPTLSADSDNQYGLAEWEGLENVKYKVVYYCGYEKITEVVPYYSTNCSAALIGNEKLKNGGKITVTVKPICDDFEGVESERSNAIIKLSAVTVGSLTNTSGNYINAQWETKTDEICMYRVFLYRNGSNNVPNGNWDISENYKIYTMDDTGEYKFTVQKIADDKDPNANQVINSEVSQKFGSVIRE